MKRFAAITFSVLMVAMMLLPTAFAADVDYKSSYAVAGFPSGVGTVTCTGSEYGVYGGLIMGNVSPSDISYLGVSGEYDSSTGDYIVTYHVELTAAPSYSVNDTLFYVAMDAPVGVTVYTRARYITSSWWQHDASSLYQFTGKKPVMAFDLSQYYPADTECCAVPITRSCFTGNTAQLQIRISDPLAVSQLKGSGKFLDTILYPFTVISERSFVVSFVASVFTRPLVAPFFALALSGLAIGLIVKFMR